MIVSSRRGNNQEKSSSKAEITDSWCAGRIDFRTCRTAFSIACLSSTGTYIVRTTPSQACYWLRKQGTNDLRSNHSVMASKNVHPAPYNASDTKYSQTTVLVISYLPKRLDIVHRTVEWKIRFDLGGSTTLHTGTGPSGFVL